MIPFVFLGMCGTGGCEVPAPHSRDAPTVLQPFLVLSQWRSRKPLTPNLAVSAKEPLGRPYNGRFARPCNVHPGSVPQWCVMRASRKFRLAGPFDGKMTPAVVRVPRRRDLSAPDRRVESGRYRGAMPSGPTGRQHCRPRDVLGRSESPATAGLFRYQVRNFRARSSHST
jgi:hypothetical protein